MDYSGYSVSERHFLKSRQARSGSSHVKSLITSDCPSLGLICAVRFLEWVSENPQGVVSLPTGKTAGHFISWTGYMLRNWDMAGGKDIRLKCGLSDMVKPSLEKLRFVQSHEFYPIDPRQHNSYLDYVRRFYFEGLGLDRSRALLIDADHIPLAGSATYREIFPELKIDLSLRYRKPEGKPELLQQESIFSIDDWCSRYENQIRRLGGLGFFLGGLGPDGHVAFNVRGSDPYSTTRLTDTSFESQALAAPDLGGMEIARNRLVITIGLGTLTFNAGATAILFSAGATNAPVVRDSLESGPSALYPATALHQLGNLRFYLTEGSASLLKSSVEQYYDPEHWNQEKTVRAVTDLCQRLDKYAHHLTVRELKEDPCCRRIPGLADDTIRQVIRSAEEKIEKGMQAEGNQVYLHTGPHHDDILLGLLPHVHRLLRNETNRAHFAILTSGFSSVTNAFLMRTLEDTLGFLDSGRLQMLRYPDFFSGGYTLKRDKDVYHFLINVASGEANELRRALSHRIVRIMVEIFRLQSVEDLRRQIGEILTMLQGSYHGEKNPGPVQHLKGMIREYEEELAWSYFGIPLKDIHHLRLGFYTGDSVPGSPERTRDARPFLELLKTINPGVISLVFDPEGSGPDTHYKVMQVIAEALRLWKEEKDISGLRIWGYRNVWSTFHPSEADVIVPVSLNAMAVMEQAFSRSYLSQVEASFPSYRFDGPFSSLTRKIWVDQLKLVQLVLGKDFFYRHSSPRIRTTHGLLFYREMKADDFLSHARRLEETMEGSGGNLPAAAFTLKDTYK